MTRKKASKKKGKTSSPSRSKSKKAKKSATKKATKKSAAKKTTSRKKVTTSKQPPKKKLGSLELDKETLLGMHDLMVKSRKLEERMIQIYKRGDAYFWIGAPGEEAFGVALGMQIQKGQGPEYDYSHLHYRCTPTLIAMGMEMEPAIRLIMNKATDPCTGGRNFSNHYCFPEWNIVPVTSPIEVQYSAAIGTAIAQRRRGNKGISIVSGGDAGTAEGDFASSLIWSSRPGFELPMYITVQNNRWGISTDYGSQHGEKYIADRGRAFGMRTGYYNGNDPIETYLAIQDDMYYIRRNGLPVLAEFEVSRLYGHSSASGANPTGDVCCIELFEDKLLRHGILTKELIKERHDQYQEEARSVAEKVRTEADPQADTIWDNVWVDNENADWRKF